MEIIPHNPILEFKPDTLITLRKQYNLEKPGDMDRAIDVLDAWIKQQDHFVKKEFPRNYLEKTIMSNKGSMERAKVKLDKICTYRTLMPDMFKDTLAPENLQELDEIYTALMPKQTNDYYRVYFVKYLKQPFTTSKLYNLMKYFILTCEYMLVNDYSNGYTLVVDCTETNLTDLIKSLNIMQLRQTFTIVNEGYGMRLKGIHFVTSSKAIETIVVIMKQVLPAKLGSRVFVHRDFNTVYECIPKEILPLEYGGKEKSLLELRKDLKEVLTSKQFVNSMVELIEAKTDETRRQTDKFNDTYMGTPGSFRSFTTD